MNRLLSAAATIGFALLIGSPAEAGTLPYWGFQFGTPTRASAQFGVTFGDSVPERGGGVGDLSIGTGTIIEASAGAGGGKIGIGKSAMVLTDLKAVRAIADYRLTLGRTWAFPRGASAHATYAGLEGGLSLSLLRVSLGVSKRLETRPVGSNWLWNWGLGLQFGGFGKGRDKSN